MAVNPIRYQLSGRSLPETILSTALDSLANGSGVTSAAISNTELDLYMDLELVLASLTPTVQNFEFYIVRQVDGTNYEDTPPLNGYVGSVYPTLTASAKRVVLPEVPVPVGTFKVHVLNRLGPALASSGNTVKGTFYRYGSGT